MDVAATIKHAPRWAWYTAGGVAVGVGALRLWKNRTTSDGTTPVDTSTDNSVTMGGDPTTAGIGGGSPGTAIISPVVIPSVQSGGDANSGVSAGVGAVSGIIDSTTGLVGTVSAVLTPIISDQGATIHDLIVGQGNTINDTITGLLANAGSAPQPQNQNPTPLPNTNPTTTTPKQTPPGKTKPKCSGDFPLLAANGDCYREEYSDGKHKMKDGKIRGKGCWHIHHNGAHQLMSPGKKC